MSRPPTDKKPSAEGAVSSKTLSAIFGALVHPARRKIVVCLHARGGEMTAGEIADRFKHSWPTTTRHLGVLEKAGVVKVGKRGRHRYYALRMHDVLRAADWLYSWSVHPAPDKRRKAKVPPYATMRNATPPKEPKHGPDEKANSAGRKFHTLL